MSRCAILLVCALVAATSLVHADLAIVQTIETASNGKSQTSALSIQTKGDMLRVDRGEEMTLILDAQTGDMVTLMHEQRGLMRISGQQLESMKKMAVGEDGEGTAESTLEATGRTKEINGYQTEEYVQQKSGVEVHFWIAKDYPNYKQILAQMQKLQTGRFAKLSGRPSSDLLALPGLPIQTVVTHGRAVTTATLTSIEEKDLDAAVFEVPTGYNEIKLPGMGGGTP